uniref:Uncharacterized protein n=1 Tax=Romanomermis culicivorax TaxID=13658 RepID=A0A915ITA2_ROMCU
MEVDTMHANIQNYRRRRNREIEIPHDWEKVFSEAVGGAGANPYVVTKLGNLIFDYKPIADLLNFPKKLRILLGAISNICSTKKAKPATSTTEITSTTFSVRLKCIKAILVLVVDHKKVILKLIAEDEKREEEIIDQMELQENELRTLELCNA